MSTPDPQTVREIAAKVANIALHDAVHVDQWISAVIDSDFGNECSQVRAPLHAAVTHRMATVRPSWSDEQQPADPMTAEQQQDGAVPEMPPVIAMSMRHLLASLNVWRVQACLNSAERDALAARVAELEGEREADVRTVAALLALGNVSFLGTWLTNWEDAKSTLAARFADRIDAFIESEAKGGE